MVKANGLITFIQSNIQSKEYRYDFVANYCVSSNQNISRCAITPSFFTIFTKQNNFSDFLFASLGNKTLQKRKSPLKGNNLILSFREDRHSEVRKKWKLQSCFPWKSNQSQTPPRETTLIYKSLSEYLPSHIGLLSKRLRFHLKVAPTAEGIHLSWNLTLLLTRKCVYETLCPQPHAWP